MGSFWVMDLGAPLPQHCNWVEGKLGNRACMLQFPVFRGSLWGLGKVWPEWESC